MWEVQDLGASEFGVESWQPNLQKAIHLFVFFSHGKRERRDKCSLKGMDSIYDVSIPIKKEGKGRDKEQEGERAGLSTSYGALIWFLELHSHDPIISHRSCLLIHCSGVQDCNMNFERTQTFILWCWLKTCD